MNDIIIKSASNHPTHQQRAGRGDGAARGSGAQLPRRTDGKLNMNEVPNLEMKMLRRGRDSEKKYQPAAVQTSLDKYQPSPRKRSEDAAGGIQRNGGVERRVDELMGNSHQHELFFKRSYTNIKNRRLFFNHKGKAKQSSFEVIGKINVTAHVAASKHWQQSRYSQQKGMAKSESCKARPMSNLMNPEELFQLHRNTQACQLSKRVTLRGNREKEKQLYEQAMSHLYEMARHSFFHERARSEMPCELDVNKIVIPKRNYREEWAEKVKKYQENAVRYRQQCEQQRVVAEGRPQERGRPVKLRAKTDAKMKQQSSRNQTEFIEKTELWMELMEKPFAPWEFESISSKFYE